MSVSEWFAQLSPVLQAFIATLFTWGVTAAGAALVFPFRDMNRSMLNAMMGFAAGVMIAASFWSLLAPAIEMSNGHWFPAATGFLAGGLFLLVADKIIPHLHPYQSATNPEGIRTSWQKSVLLVMAILLHHIPEGLAVGIAFGAAGAGFPSATLGTAVALSIGMGIQNFPEGLAVSMPLRREGLSSRRAFFWGQISGSVEPVAGVVGATAVILIQPLMPYALAFAAGAMIYVVAEELIPTAKNDEQSDLPTVSLIIGFCIMMILDVAFG